jgi:hypothetical protein
VDNRAGDLHCNVQFEKRKEILGDVFERGSLLLPVRVVSQRVHGTVSGSKVGPRHLNFYHRL